MKIPLKKNVYRGSYSNIVREIKTTTTQFESCSFIFEGRFTNIEAHSLAKHAFDLDLGQHLWLLNPLDIHCILINIIDY